MPVVVTPFIYTADPADGGVLLDVLNPAVFLSTEDAARAMDALQSLVMEAGYFVAFDVE